MTHTIRVFALLFCALSLTACVSREQADEKLARACSAGVSAILPEGQEIGPIGDKKFTPASDGPNMRHVALTVKMDDGWIEDNTTYECVFEENFGFMRTTYTASLYNLKAGERIFGKSGNEISGDAEDFIKLTDAVRKALYE